MTIIFDDIKVLVEEVLAGNSMASAQLYHRVYPHIYQVAYNTVKDSHEAEDMVQEAFHLIFLNLHRVPNTQYFIPWCKKITTNYCLRYLESPLDMPVENMEVYLSHKESAHRDPLVDVLTKERKDLLLAKIDEVDPVLSTTIELRYYYNYKMSEIAEIMDCPEGTVKSRLNRAKKVVREIAGSDTPFFGVFGGIFGSSLLLRKKEVLASGSKLSSGTSVASSSSYVTPALLATTGIVAIGSSVVVSQGIALHNENNSPVLTNTADTVIVPPSDVTVPLLKDYQLEENTIVVYMEDLESGINYNSVYGITASGTNLMPLRMDQEKGILYFDIIDEHFTLYVSDNAGNTSLSELRLVSTK